MTRARVSSAESRVAWCGVAFITAAAAVAAIAGSLDHDTTASFGAPRVAVLGERQEPDTPSAEDSGPAPSTPVAPTFTVAATGDIIVHETVAQQAAEYATDGTFDFAPMFADVAPVLSAADLAICHLESPVSADNTDLSYYPAFRVPFQIVDAVAGAGYDGCSLASNHALDGGPPTVVATLERTARAGLTTTGMATSADGATRATLYQVAGATVGHLSYTYGLNTGDLPADQPYLTNIIDQNRILAAAASLKAAGAEFVITSLHWGTEYQAEPNEQQNALVEPLLASPDIDLILGSHAHVVQPIIKAGNEYAVMGMGNFLSNQSPETCSECPATTQDGVIVRFTVTERAPGTFIVSSVDPVPTTVDRERMVIVPLAGPNADSALESSRQRTLATLGSRGALG